MADFVAVIRRAVDGLSTNTPEMRAKVYEKARGAVQRQLENMKPRPPEDMLQRQMQKLETAIISVEAEHAEALPAPEPVEPEPEQAQFEPDVAPAEQHEEPETAAYEYEAADRRDPEPVETESAYEEPAAPEEPLQPAYGDWRDEETAAEQPPAAVVQDAFEEPTPSDAASDEAYPYEEPAAPEPAKPVQYEDDFPYPSRPGQDAQSEPDFARTEPVWQPEPPQPAEEPAKEADDDWGWPSREPEAATTTGGQATEAAAVWDDVPELVPAGPVEPIHHGGHLEAVDAHFDQEQHVAVDTVRMPAVSDLPDLAAANAAAAAADPFADEPRTAPIAAEPKKPEEDPWADLEELIGYNKNGVQADTTRTQGDSGDADDLMMAPPRPYRVTPVKKRNYAGLVLGIIGLALVGGGAYAVWLNRDSLNDMVGGLINPSPSETETVTQTPASTPATTPVPTATAPATQSGGTNTAAAPQTSPAAADGSTSGSKFTQRLMADGTEVDEGPGGAGGLAQNAEGQSVAQLNAPPATPTVTPPTAGAPAATPPTAGAPVATATPPAAAAAPNTATPPANTPSATPADAPALAGEKMFLYEERLGQTAPTAIDGAVSWSLQREPGANGVQEPVVQGRINIPGRGLTALMTFKRNSDPSLPASHLIEIVFAVPPDFDGGAIDSVQRIAMKQSEQDRGNALIAVPAKITDDFHMIALNDFPDARTTNLDLLRTRNWIDIPVAYRNGRRALFTMQKGPEGERAFNDAIREWGQMSGSTTGQ